MERAIAVLLCMVIGFMFFASVLSFTEKMKEPAEEGEARVLVRELQMTVTELVSAGRDAYAESSFELPDEIGGKDFTVSFYPGGVTITTFNTSVSGSIRVSNSKTFQQGETIHMVKTNGSDSVVVL